MSRIKETSYTFEDSNRKTGYIFYLIPTNQIKIYLCRIDNITQAWMIQTSFCIVKYSNGDIDWDSGNIDFVMSYEAKRFIERTIRFMIFM